MEDVLDVYHRPFDERRPLVCIDEVPVQLVGEARTPLPARPGTPARYDYEYVRNGTANLFMVFQPLTGWRHVSVTDRRTAKDFAELLRWLVEDIHAEAKTVVLVTDIEQDNLYKGARVVVPTRPDPNLRMKTYLCPSDPTTAVFESRFASEGKPSQREISFQKLTVQPSCGCRKRKELPFDQGQLHRDRRRRLAAQAGAAEVSTPEPCSKEAREQAAKGIIDASHSDTGWMCRMASLPKPCARR
jgi:hypothetical protein